MSGTYHVAVGVVASGDFDSRSRHNAASCVAHVARSLSGHRLSIAFACDDETLLTLLDTAAYDEHPEAVRLHYLSDGRRVRGGEALARGWRYFYPHESAASAIESVVASTWRDHRPSMLLVLRGRDAELDAASACSVGVPARAHDCERAASQVVWLDTETTGLSPNACGLIEVGAVATENGSRQIVGQIELRGLIEPWMQVYDAALAVNGYRPRLWEETGYDHDLVVSLLCAWLPPSFTLAAYNVPFDRGVLRAACKRAGLDEPGWFAKTIDPQYAVRKQLKHTGAITGSKLVHACEYLGIPTDAAHTALWDAHAARLVYLGLLGEDVAALAAAAGL